jgi:halocyanin-like protein
MRRRDYLSFSLSLTGAVAAAGCVGEASNPPAGPDASYGDWFDGMEGFDGEVDRTDTPAVTVEVGAGNGFAFSPVAVVVSRGTAVTWRWTGRGGQHNVVARDGTFESPLHSREGATFERGFDRLGLYPYYCAPHRSLDMVGGVRVRDD